jgi:hypothetical protein
MVQHLLILISKHFVCLYMMKTGIWRRMKNKPGEWNLFVGTSVLVSDFEWWGRQAIDLPRKPRKEFVLGSSNPRQIFLVRT